jgi:DNA polymerase I-like protein with 3'-5' exonuclease and polymerase domains
MAMPSGCEIWCLDTEWGFHSAHLDHESAWEPVVLCLVGLRSGRRLYFWGRDPRLPPFFSDHADDLFVSHNALAEMKYLLRFDIPPPAHWFDTYVARRYVTNRPNKLEAGLSLSLHQLGLPGLAPAEKKELQLKILYLRFNPDSPDDRTEIVDYCYSDCDGCGALYARVHERVAPELMAHWVVYLKAVARMELRGVPFEVESLALIQERQSVIKAALIGDINETWPVFEGESFRLDSFLKWCRRVGIDWPTTVSPRTRRPYYPHDKETFKAMEGRHPFIGKIRQVRKTLAQFGNRSLVVDPLTRRHYFSTCVFRSVTGRNQPKNFVFSGPKWLRQLIVPESPDHLLVYVDFVAEEFGIAAALSGDPTMRAIYEASDCHMAFAERAGAVPADPTKETLRKVRQRYKTVNLGVLYGQTAFGIAARLGITHPEAEALLQDHRTLFPTFWKWSERLVQGSIDRGWIVTPCGWRSLVPPFSNERTWMNFPMQATGADIMRLMITYLDRQNVRILAPVHDGFLLSCRRNQLRDLQEAVEYARRNAVEHVLPGFPLRCDVTTYDHRFEDEDGLPLWNRLREIVPEVGRVSVTE